MRIEEVKQVLILGSGTMGQQIGLQSAWCGLATRLYDIEAKALERADHQIQKYIQSLVKRGLMNEAEADATYARLEFIQNPMQAAQNVDFVNESVPENPQLKAKVFAQFHTLCPERTIFTTNTSTLLPSMFAEETGRPAQFAAFHFHHPWEGNIVDIMPHPGTSPEVVEFLHQMAVKLRQIPIFLHKEHPGYVFNAMFSNFLLTALSLKVNGVASVEDIDRSWMGVMRMSRGPFGIMDSVGLDTLWHITNYWAQASHDSKRQAMADFIKNEFLDQGKLGLKSGEGFYQYPNPSYTQPGFLSGPASKPLA